jgi:hypothetical protein
MFSHCFAGIEKQIEATRDRLAGMEKQIEATWEVLESKMEIMKAEIRADVAKIRADHKVDIASMFLFSLILKFFLTK